MFHTYPALTVAYFVALLIIVGLAVRWFIRECNGDNYRAKYPHADAHLKTMIENKVDAAEAAAILGLRSSKK